MEQVREHHERRMAKLETMIEDRRAKVEDHESGRRLLSDEEYERATRQFSNFKRKLQQMQESNNDVSIVSLRSTVHVV